MKTERFEMRVSQETLAMLDDLCKNENDTPTRAEMLRRLIECKWKKINNISSSTE